MTILNRIKLAAIVIAWTVLAVTLTYIIVSHRMQADAVRHGAGEWTVDENANMTFKWKGKPSVGQPK
jgi:hypothetical protein